MSRRVGFMSLSVCLVAAMFVIGCAPDQAPAPSPSPSPTATTPSPSQPASDVIKWKFGTHITTGMRYYVVSTRISERVNQMSDGQLILECSPGDAIVPATKELEAVHDGVMEAAVTGHMYSMHLFPAAGLFYQVTGGLTALQMQLWYLSGGGDALAEEMYAPLDVHYVATSLLHPPEIWAHTNKPLVTPDDIEGLKFRVAGDAGQILARMGAATSMIPGGEIYEAVSRGVIDAFEYGGPAVNWDQGFQEVADYMYLSPSRAPTGGNAMFVNQKAWDSLTPDLQVMIRLAAQAEMQEWYAEEIVLDDLALQKFIDYGTVVEQLPKSIDDEFRRVSAEFYTEKAAADPFFKKVLDSQQAFQLLCNQQDIR